MDGSPTKMLWMVTAVPAAISALTCYLIIQAHKNRSLKVIALEDKRRQHVGDIPLLGGTGIIAALFTCFLYLGISTGGRHVGGVDLPFAAMALLVCLGVGASDDIFEIHPLVKLGGQALVSLLLLLAVRGLQTPSHALVPQYPWAGDLINFFWAMGLLNSFNLIDGLDGLASGLGMIAVGFLGLLQWNMGHELPVLHIGFVCAISGFFLWNRHPARIFLGESGAMAVASAVFLASMEFHASPLRLVNFAAPLFAVFVPIIDTALAIFRRISRKTSILKGDREHVHHRLMRLGISHHNTVRFIHILAVYFCLIAYQFITAENFSTSGLGLVFVGLAINIMLLMTAEQKLYSYLTKFASHMLKLIDQNNYGILSSHMRMKQLYEEGIPFVAYRLNLENSVKTLLEKSPGKMQSFFLKLLTALKGGAAREVFFESSESVLILQTLKAGNVLEDIKIQLQIDLVNFETEEKVDLYLSVPSTLQPVNFEPAPLAPVKDIRRRSRSG